MTICEFILGLQLILLAGGLLVLLLVLIACGNHETGPWSDVTIDPKHFPQSDD